MSDNALFAWLHRRYRARTASAYCSLLQHADPLAYCRRFPSAATTMLAALRARRAFVADTGALVPSLPPDADAELHRLAREYRMERRLQPCVPPSDVDALVARALALDPMEVGVVPALALGALAGLRLGSVLGVAWRDVEARELVVRTAKGGRPYRVPLHPKLAAYLGGLRARRGGADPDRVVEVPRWRLQRQFAALGVRSHALRRGFATALLDRGVPIATVARLMNHADPATTYGYYRPTDDTMAEAIQKL